MAYNTYFDDLPDDLANLSIASSLPELSEDDLSYLVRSIQDDLSDSYYDTMSDPNRSDIYRDLSSPDPNSSYIYGPSEPSTSGNYLDPYDSMNQHSNGHSPYHESSYNDSLYPDDSYRSSSTSPYPSYDEQSMHLPPSEVSSVLYDEYGSPSPDPNQGGRQLYSPDPSYLLSPAGSSADPMVKPKQKRDRKTKGFYESLTKEQKREREKEKCKLRVQRFREREKLKQALMAQNLGLDQEQNIQMRAMQLEKIKTMLTPEQREKLLKQMSKKGKR